MGCIDVNKKVVPKAKKSKGFTEYVVFYIVNKGIVEIEVMRTKDKYLEENIKDTVKEKGLHKLGRVQVIFMKLTDFMKILLQLERELSDYQCKSLLTEIYKLSK